MPPSIRKNTRLQVLSSTQPNSASRVSLGTRNSLGGGGPHGTRTVGTSETGRTPVTSDQLSSALDRQFERFSELFRQTADELRSHIVRIDQDIADLNDRVARLENSNSDDKLDEINVVSAVCDEMRERNRRALNVIIYGLAARDKSTNDLELVNELLRGNPNMPLASRAQRIGKPDSSNRPLKLTFSSHADIKTVFENKQFFIDNNLKISNDRTPRERELLVNLRAKLQERINNGESSLTIRYIRGTPTIVQKNF